MRKRVLFTIFMIVVFASTQMGVGAAKMVKSAPGRPSPTVGCIGITQGNLIAPDGASVPRNGIVGGYNYLGRSFSGSYCESTYDGEGCGQAYQVTKSWIDAYVSNRSCDGDLNLDLHAGSATYQGSGAQVTVTSAGVYDSPDFGYAAGTPWSYSAKFTAVPANAWHDAWYWYWYEGGTLKYGKYERAAGYEYFVRTQLSCVNCE
jgi:hypothetical protein